MAGSAHDALARRTSESDLDEHATILHVDILHQRTFIDSVEPMHRNARDTRAQRARHSFAHARLVFFGEIWDTQRDHLWIDEKHGRFNAIIFEAPDHAELAWVLDQAEAYRHVTLDTDPITRLIEERGGIFEHQLDHEHALFDRKFFLQAGLK